MQVAISSICKTFFLPLPLTMPDIINNIIKTQGTFLIVGVQAGGVCRHLKEGGDYSHTVIDHSRKYDNIP